MSDFESDSVPSDIEAGAENVVASLIPEKSREAYKQAVVKLEEWCNSKIIHNDTQCHYETHNDIQVSVPITY